MCNIFLITYLLTFTFSKIPALIKDCYKFNLIKKKFGLKLNMQQVREKHQFSVQYLFEELKLIYKNVIDDSIKSCASHCDFVQCHKTVLFAIKTY